MALEQVIAVAKKKLRGLQSDIMNGLQKILFYLKELEKI